nr:MAG TPA: hypothetical protein [Bacteriophage sp.]
MLIAKRPSKFTLLGGTKCKKGIKNTGQHLLLPDFPCLRFSYFPSLKYSKKPMYGKLEKCSSEFI